MSALHTPSKRASRREHWESFWQERREGSRVYSNADRILRNLRDAVALRGKLVLEIGAGTGRDSFPLAEHGAIVYHQLDYAEGSLSILRRLADASRLPVHIVGGDTFRVPFRDESFDIVFHQGLLEHFRPPQAEALLRENIRVLRRGGFFPVDVPRRYHTYTVVKHLLIALNRWFAGWGRSFSIGELRRLLGSLGLEITHAYGEWMYPSFSDRSLREAMKAVRIELPLDPQTIKVLSRVRSAARQMLWKTRLPQLSGFSIGVIGRKP